MISQQQSMKKNRETAMKTLSMMTVVGRQRRLRIGLLLISSVIAMLSGVQMVTLLGSTSFVSTTTDIIRIEPSATEINASWSKNDLQEYQVGAVTNSTFSWSPQQKSFLGIQPRVWTPWPADEPFPCYNPGNQKVRFNSEEIPFPLRMKPFWLKNAFGSPKVRPTHGLLFVKPMKVGGSSGVGVQLRISKNMAERRNNNLLFNINGTSATTTTTKNSSFPICENSYDHAMGKFFRNRDVKHSFLWSLLREPTKRSVSYFWHFFVSRKNVAPTTRNFIRVMSQLKNYYIKIHSLNGRPTSKQVKAKDRIDPVAAFHTNTSEVNSTNDRIVQYMANKILDQYDFLAITERFDESMVVLHLLLRVPLGDILYLSAKVHGGYDNLCHYIQDSKLTQGMIDYLQNPDGEFIKNIIRWDKALYDAANASLDRTIDEVLGRERVEHTLKRFQAAQRQVKMVCQPQIKMGCETATTGGKPRPRPPEETNCLFQDSACAYQCIDQVAKDLGLD